MNEETKIESLLDGDFSCETTEDLYPVIDRVMVAYKLGEGLAGYNLLTNLYKPLKDLALTGGYYYIVLPELKIE